MEEVASPDHDVLSAVAGRSREVADEQLRQQAAELAEQLTRRHRDLARWEATLNARSAQYDDHQRAARLWLREQQNALESREAEIRQREQSLDARVAEWESARQVPAAVMREREQQLEETLTQQRRQLQLELDHVRQEAASLEQAHQNWERQCREEQQTLAHLREQLLDQRRVTEQLNVQLRERLAHYQRVSEDADAADRRQQSLHVQATELREAEAALDRQRQRLLNDQEMWQQRTARQRSALAAHWRGRLRSLQQYRQTLARQSESLDRQRETLAQEQQQLEAERQEVARQRLALQHAEAVAEKRVSPHDFRHLAQAIQQRVEAQLNISEQTLATQRRELQTLASGLLRQQKSLQVRHARMQEHIMSRQRELDAQTAQLAEREQMLCQREMALLVERDAHRTPPS